MEDYELIADADFGVSPRTIRALVEKGLIVPDDDGDDPSYLITNMGRSVLGVNWTASTKPKRITTALKRALRALLPGSAEAVFVKPREMTAMWHNDDVQYDFSDALICLEEVYEDDEIELDALAQMVGDAGFPCYLERTRDIVIVWPSEE